jgi:hypothetical protein
VGIEAKLIVNRHSSTEEMLAEYLASLQVMAQADRQVNVCLGLESDKLQMCLGFRRSESWRHGAAERRIDEELLDVEWLSLPLQRAIHKSSSNQEQCSAP